MRLDCGPGAVQTVGRRDNRRGRSFTHRLRSVLSRMSYDGTVCPHGATRTCCAEALTDRGAAAAFSPCRRRTPLPRGRWRAVTRRRPRAPARAARALGGRRRYSGQPGGSPKICAKLCPGVIESRSLTTWRTSTPNCKSRIDRAAQGLWIKRIGLWPTSQGDSRSVDKTALTRVWTGPLGPIQAPSRFRTQA